MTAQGSVGIENVTAHQVGIDTLQLNGSEISYQPLMVKYKIVMVLINLPNYK